MSVPNPTGSTARSKLGIVLEYLQSLLPEVDTPPPQEVPQAPSQGSGQTAVKGVVDDLESVASTLKLVDQGLLPGNFKAVDDERAVLRHQCNVAAKEYDKASDEKGRAVVEGVFRTLGERAAALKTRAVDLQNKCAAVRDYATVEPQVTTALDKSVTIEPVLVAQRTLKVANEEYLAKRDAADAAQTALLVESVRQKLAALTQIEQEQAAAKLKVAEKFLAVGDELQSALKPVAGPKSVTEAHAGLDKAHKAYVDGVDAATAEQAEGLLTEVLRSLEALESAKQTESEAKLKVNERYSGLEARVTTALAPVTGPQSVTNAQTELDKAQKAYTTGFAAATSEQAATWCDEVEKHLGLVETARQQEADARKKVIERYVAMKSKVVEALAPMPESSKALTDAQGKLKKAQDDYVAKEADGTADELDTLLKLVEAALPEVVTARETHANNVEKTRYYKRLKKCHARIAAIDKGIVDKKYGDPPVDPLDKKVADYSKARLEVKQAQDAQKFAEANAALTRLETAAGELEKARLTAMNAEISGADTANKVGAVVTKLDPHEIRALSADQQVALLKTLRTTAGKAITEKGAPDLYKARCKLYDNIALHPECDKQDKAFRGKILAAFDSETPEPDDPKYPDYKGKTPKEIFAQAKKDWGSMTADQQFTFLSFAAKKQCAVMGHPEPDVVQGTDPNEYPPRSCANAILTCENSACTHVNQTWHFFPAKSRNCPHCGTEFGDADPCETPWHNATGKGTCSNVKCGAVDSGVNCSFGGCDLALINGADKSTITLNNNANVVGDFQETFDTIMHENAHNYQLYLVKRYRADKNKLFTDIPSARDIEDQIKLWDENANGYVPDGPTYNNQPLELHAWRFGRKMATKKLTPKAKTAPGDKPVGVADLA